MKCIFRISSCRLYRFFIIRPQGLSPAGAHYLWNLLNGRHNPPEQAECELSIPADGADEGLPTAAAALASGTAIAGVRRICTRSLQARPRSSLIIASQ